jgi:hypothetical protein
VRITPLFVLTPKAPVLMSHLRCVRSTGTFQHAMTRIAIEQIAGTSDVIILVEEFRHICTSLRRAPVLHDSKDVLAVVDGILAGLET